MQSFILPANGAATPKSIERKRKMAEAMMAQGIDTSPIASPWQGAARMAQALVGGLGSRKADRQEAEGTQSAKEAMMRALSGGDNSSVIDAVSNPFMDSNSMPLLTKRWSQLNPDPAPPPEPYTLGQGQLRLDGNNNVVAEGLPKTPDSVINNNVDMKGQTAYAVDRGKGFAKTAGDIDEGERAAFKTLNSLNQMENLIQDPSFYSGFGAEQLQAIKSMAVSLGADPNSVSSMEQFNTLSKQAALDTMGGSLGTGFSNADRDFVVGQVPFLGNTPEGNKSIIGINRKMQERKIQIAKMAREYEIQNGQLDAGFMQQLSDWAEQNPLFADQAQQVPPPVPQSAPQPGSPGGKTSTGVPWSVQ